eukprot:scaffold322053_cov79-Cyclotella_meneghiniana.AAC.1
MTDETNPLARPNSASSYLHISSNPSLVQFPSAYTLNSSEIEPSDCLDESLTEILFSSLSSFVQYQEEDLVDMEDDEILELWQHAHQATALSADVNKMDKIVEKSSLAGGDATRGAITQAPMPTPRVFAAKSA